MPEIPNVSANGDQQPMLSPGLPDTPDLIARLQSLDVLRGIAVLGGLLIGIWMFGGFTVNQQTNLQLHPHGLDYRMYATLVLLLEGKMLGLISLVFGAGIIIFMASKSKLNHLSMADVFIRRQMWLILFGLVNALVFLSSGDILFHLGIMGILLFPFTRLSGRGLLIAAIVTSFIFSGKNYWNYADDQERYTKYVAVIKAEKKIERDSLNRRKKDAMMRLQGKAIATATKKKDTLTAEQQEDKQAWEGMIKGMKYDPKKDDGKLKSMQDLSFGKIWDHLLPNIQSKEAQWTYRIGVWEIAALMFLGMALFKYGFFSGRFTAGQYLLFALCGLTVGILLGLFRMYFHAGMYVNYERYIRHHWFAYNLLYPFEKAFMVLGYASLIMLLLQQQFLRGLWNILASVGQMALTNYLMQSIICALFFYGYAMGYFGRLSQLQLYMVVAEIWIVQITYSVLWLKSFKYGPAEWLLRCLSYGKWLPFKHNTHDMSIPSPSIF